MEEFFNQYFWPSYPADLTHNRKGAKSAALKAFKKLNLTELQCKDIMSKLEVLVKADRALKKVGKEPLRWPYASTWINQERWNMVEDMQSVSAVIQESTCGCGGKATVEGKCQECFYTERDKQYDREFLAPALERVGLPMPQGGADKETIREWQHACRQWCRDNAGRVLGHLTGERA